MKEFLDKRNLHFQPFRWNHFWAEKVAFVYKPGFSKYQGILGEGLLQVRNS